jgi:hypothetical protein
VNLIELSYDRIHVLVQDLSVFLGTVGSICCLD